MRATENLRALKAELDGIGHVLRDLSLSVPSYQRSFSWEKEQVAEFWDDLRSTLLSRDPNYFLGTIVLTGESRSRDRTIIDGQQRLVTTSILLAAIRDAFMAAGDPARAEVLQNTYLAQHSLASASREPRLVLNTQDAEYFNSTVLLLNSERLAPAFASNDRIAAAYEFLREKIGNEVESSKHGWADHLLRWVDFLEGSVQVIVVEVLSDTDAFLVFETLNDRGLALTVADLLKNYLYGLARDSIESVERAWLNATATLDAPGGEQQLLEFIRHYWSSLHGATRERELYRSLRRHIRSGTQARELAAGLEAASRNYLAITSPELELWPSQNIGQEVVETLHGLRLSQHRPLLLAALDHFGEEEWIRLVRSVISWSVRGVIVGGIGGGTTERYFSDAAVSVRSGRSRTAHDVFQLLQPIIPSDEEFTAAAEVAQVPRTHLARYYWRAFDRHVQGYSDAAFLSWKGDADLAVIRGVPEPPVPGLPSENADVQVWIKRFGNTAVVEREFIGRERSLPWGTLDAISRLSSLQNVRMFAEWREWTSETIRERQHRFASAAPLIWPRVPEVTP